MNEKHCEFCKFFEATDAASGVCRRMPPAPFPTGPDKVTSFWPSVNNQHWCGEYVLRLLIAKELPISARTVQ